jgi:hypothetical protein
LNGVFRAVPTLEIASLWPGVAVILAPAIKRAELFYKADDIRQRLADERMQLWVIESNGAVRMALITEVLVYPQIKALGIPFAAGEGFGLWKHILQDLSECGRQFGCRAIVSQAARDGWERAAGFKKVGTAYAMEL